MALFGLPGGAEWLVIGITALILFVPGLGFGLLGYVLGRRSAKRELPAAPASAGPPDAGGDAKDPGESEVGHE